MAAIFHSFPYGLLFVLGIPTIHAYTNITLSTVIPEQYYVFNNECQTSCQPVYVSSPTGTILVATFLDLQIPADNKVTFTNLDTNKELVAVSGISLAIDPIFVDSSRLKMEVDKVYSTDQSHGYLNVKFSFKDQLQVHLVRSSGGAFSLSDTYPSITLQSANLSTTTTDLEAKLHWFITPTSNSWIQVDILDMELGMGAVVCVIYTFGQWVCMRNSVSSTTWYSYDREIRLVYTVKREDQPQPGAGMTVRLTLIDHSTWNGQSLTIPSCNPTVTLQEAETIRFTSPFFNRSLENVTYDCRITFTPGIQTGGIQYQYIDVLDGVRVYTRENGYLLILADATNIHLGSQESPIISMSPNHELYVMVYKFHYHVTSVGLMVQPYTGDILNGGPEPLSSFGLAMELNDASFQQEFTTPGYPNLPNAVFKIKWRLDNLVTGAAIRIQFIDFDIGEATLIGHVEEIDQDLWQLTGSMIPDDILTNTTRLTLLLQSHSAGLCCNRGIHFNLTLMNITTMTTARPILTTESPTSEITTARPIQTSESSTSDITTARPIQTTESPTSEITTARPIQTTESPTSEITTARPIRTTESPTSADSTAIGTYTTDKTEITTARPIQTTESPTSADITTIATHTTGNKDGENPKGADSPNVLTIALSVSVVMAFFIIGFLVCVLVYRNHGNWVLARETSHTAPTNPTSCPFNGATQNGPAWDPDHLNFPLSPPQDPPPHYYHDYETISDPIENVAYGGSDRGSYIYAEPGESVLMTNGERENDKLHKGYSTTIFKHVSSAGNRDSADVQSIDAPKPDGIEMNGSASQPDFHIRDQHTSEFNTLHA